jgi:predicted Zn-dependent protease
MLNNRFINRLMQMVAAIVVIMLLPGFINIKHLPIKRFTQRSGENAARLLNRAVEGGKILVSGTLPIGYEEEAAIGKAMALHVISRFGGIYDQPDITRYVNLVGRGVAQTSDRPNIPYYFAVLAHPSLNAFATPGGYVFITKGLLQRLRNEAELAAVLGHEIAHISEKHMLKIIQRQKQLAGIKHLMPDTFQGVVDEAVNTLLDKGLDQRKELAADRLGVHFAARVGYEPRAYHELLQRLRALKGDNHAVFKTHPDFSSRIGVVAAAIDEQQPQARHARLGKRFRNSVGGRL